MNAVLYVPEGQMSKYQSADKWKNFWNIVEYSDDGTEIESKKCATPTIQYSKGKLIFNCTTEGATCQSTITDSDINSYSSNEVQLGVTYNISVYATKPGYEISDIATATLCWIDVDPKTEGIANGVAHLPANPVLIQTHDGLLAISGVNDGTEIAIYSLSGQMVASTKANGNQLSVPTNLKRGEVAIIKIGEKTVKVVMQ